jgi:hypothetical protein
MTLVLYLFSIRILGVRDWLDMSLWNELSRGMPESHQPQAYITNGMLATSSTNQPQIDIYKPDKALDCT